MLSDFKIYTIDEVANILKVCKQTVRNYISSGKLSKINMDGVTRIKHESLEKLINGDENEVV